MCYVKAEMLNRAPEKESLAKLMSDAQTAELTELFRLLSDRSRLRIILTCLNRALPVGDIAAELELSPSLVSHHLRLLRASRLVTAQRSGRNVFYIVTDEHIRRVLSDMVEHVLYG